MFENDQHIPHNKTSNDSKNHIFSFNNIVDYSKKMIVLLYKYSEINPKKELSNQTSLKKLTFYLEIVFVDLF